MPDFDKVYWDTCAWLGLINSEPEKIRPLQHLYEECRRGKLEIWTSTLIYVELFRVKAEEKDEKPYSDEGLDKIKQALEQPFIQLVSLDMEVGRKARGLRRRLPGLSGPGDAIHLASALIWGISPLHTWDGSHLLPFDGQLSCKDGTLLKICVPDEPPEGPLFKKGKEE
jgi:predicted nucleic acid-binding protein